MYCEDREVHARSYIHNHITSCRRSVECSHSIPSLAWGGGVPTKYGIGLAQELVQTFWRTENVCSCTEANSRYPSHELATILCKYSFKSHCRPKRCVTRVSTTLWENGCICPLPGYKNETVQLTGSPTSSDRWVHLQNHFYKTVITYERKKIETHYRNKNTLIQW